MTVKSRPAPQTARHVIINAATAGPRLRLAPERPGIPAPGIPLARLAAGRIGRRPRDLRAR